jgi:NCS1 nucleoside transporter family
LLTPSHKRDVLAGLVQACPGHPRLARGTKDVDARDGPAHDGEETCGVDRMTTSELRADIHSVEPIPDADRDSSGPEQMWIWAGANIAPINWALGALGIVLKLGLWDTIVVIAAGNLIGCAVFAAFTVMGHRTGVNQMVLSRSAFGRRGAYLPSALMLLMTLGWIGVYTYFPVKIAVAILGQFGISDNLSTNLIVITVVMALQVLIGVYGFYAIRTFEKYTVPATAAVMVLMSVLAWMQPGVVNWRLTSPLPPGAHLAALSLFTTAVGVGWGISWVPWASDYSRFVRRNVSSASVFWYSYVGVFVPTVWLAILGATVASVTEDTDPAQMVSAVFGGVAGVLVLLLVLHGSIATNILNVYSAALAALSAGVRFSRTGLALIVGIAGYLFSISFIFAPSFAASFENFMASQLLWTCPWAGVVMADFFIRRRASIDLVALYAAPQTSAYGDINWNGMIAFVAGLVAGWSMQVGLLPALQGPISTGLLGGADLSWVAGIVVSAAAYLGLGRRVVADRVAVPAAGAE